MKSRMVFVALLVAGLILFGLSAWVATLPAQTRIISEKDALSGVNVYCVIAQRDQMSPVILAPDTIKFVDGKQAKLYYLTGDDGRPTAALRVKPQFPYQYKSYKVMGDKLMILMVCAPLCYITIPLGIVILMGAFAYRGLKPEVSE